jgi:hypothetical protein
MLNVAIKQFSGLVVGSPVVDEEEGGHAKDISNYVMSNSGLEGSRLD